MHELGIANAVIEAVKAEAAKRPESHPTKVGVRIGELSGVDEGALRFSFDAIIRGTELDGLQLQIEFCPRRHRCLGCGGIFVVRDYDVQCPACASAATAFVSGAELELAYLEMKENEPSATGAQSTERK
jgi:hydrogenase nickel incorporation protein HypA/HybF